MHSHSNNANLTIRVREETQKGLNSLKITERETYDEVIRKLIEFHNAHKNGEFTKQEVHA